MCGAMVRTQPRPQSAMIQGLTDTLGWSEQGASQVPPSHYNGGAHVCVGTESGGESTHTPAMPNVTEPVQSPLKRAPTRQTLSSSLGTPEMAAPQDKGS